MDEKPAEGINKSTRNSNDISKEKRPNVQQQDDGKFKQMISVHPENNEDVSLIQASKGKGKYSFMSDEASSIERNMNTSSVLLSSNSRCSEIEVHSEKYASFKGSSENLKRDFGSETELVRLLKIASSTTLVKTEQIIGESNLSSLDHAGSDEESEISSEEGKRHLFNEYTKDFFESEEVNKKAGFRGKKFPKSDISPKNKETNTMSGMDFKKEQILPRVAYPVCCRNEETETNVAETVNILVNATADAAGPSGVRSPMPAKGNKNRFACNVCHEEFAEIWEFDAHYRTHSVEKAFVCDICQRKFSQKALLERHYRTHTGEKLFVCEVCNKGFSKQQSLNIHSRIHTGEKPFVCDVCKKRFKQMNHFKIHWKTHTGEKPFVCDVCQKRFIDKSNLKVHYRTHTGEKPFECKICKKRFSDQSHLKKHYRIHTGEKPFVCDVCQRGFSQQGNLKVHYKTHK